MRQANGYFSQSAVFPPCRLRVHICFRDPSHAQKRGFGLELGRPQGMTSSYDEDSAGDKSIGGSWADRVKMQQNMINLDKINVLVYFQPGE